MTLLDGRTIDQGVVYFNKGTYQFSGPDGENLTDLITRADKMKFAGFDTSVENERLYKQQYQARTGQGAPVLDTRSTGQIFMEGVTGDIRNLATGVVTDVTDPIKGAVQSLLVLGGVAAVVYFFILKK